MTVNAISMFLASPAEVQHALQHDADFRSFHSLALKSSGESAMGADLAAAQFRVSDSRAGTRDGLALEDEVMVWGQLRKISELVAVCSSHDRTQLIHSLWKLETFDEVKLWLKALGAVVRLVYDLDGQLRGHLLLAETIIPMVETVERKDYVLPNGDMASDAITRNFGIRAKVFALDRSRRQPRGPGGNSIMDRLSRTLSKANH